MLSSSGASPRWLSRPFAASIAKLAMVNGSLRSAMWRKRRSGESAIGALVADDAAGTAIVATGSSSPLSRSIARTLMSGPPAFET